MPKSRLEAFSDGVLAIIITIMVLELKTPASPDLAALLRLGHVSFAYVMSFLYVGIYWNNHHHLFHTVTRVTAGTLWANLLLLFWLSLFPFATAWAGQNPAAPLPTAVYGAVLLLAALFYYILQRTIIASHGPHSILATAIGHDWKGKISPVIYIAAIPLAFLNPHISQALYLGVAILWTIPDRRIERALKAGS